MATAVDMATIRAAAKSERSPRPFRLVDAMLLVAGTAMGCALMQWLPAFSDGGFHWTELWQEAADTLRTEGWGHGVFYLSCEAIFIVWPLVATWTLALIPMRMLRPRDRWRRLARQPGLVAAVASGGVLLLIAALGYFVAVASGGGSVGELIGSQLAVLFAPMLIGLTVLTSWMTLLACGCWRAERSWIDRLGRAAGTFWILAGLAMGTFMIRENVMSPCCTWKVAPAGTQGASAPDGATSPDPGP